MSRVKAISGSTGEEFNKLKAQALQLGADTAFSSKEAASGMENLASAGFTTNEIMKAMPGMLNLAASSGETIATSSDIAAAAIRGFGLQASDAAHVSDVLATNASKTNAQVADTGEALKFVSTNAHAAGWSIEETVAAIGDLSNFGIKGTQAGTTLREMLVRLASPSKEAAGDMKTLGFNAFDSQGKMKSLSTIVGDYAKALQGKTDQQKQDYTATIFGQEAMSGMLALVQGGSGALDDLTNAYKNSDGAAAAMAKTMQDNAKSGVEQMMGSLETTAIKLEEDFAPTIISICNDIQNLANAFSALTPEQQEFYAKTLLAVAAGGPALKLVGGLTDGIGSLITNVSKFAKFLAPAAAAETALGAEAAAASTGGLAAFGGALSTIAPIALPIIAALAAVAVGVAAVATANDQMGDKLTTTTDDMTDWQKAINGMTGYTFKSKKELSDLGIEYKQFGDNISDNFKKKVEESTDTLHKFELFLQTINLDGIITDSESADFNNQIEKMVNDAIATISSKKSETNKSLSDLFKLDDNTIDETEQKVLDTMAKGYDDQISQENQLKADILAIKQKAVDEKRALNEQEIKDVKDKTSKIKQIELDAVGGTKEEKDYSKNEFGARVETVSATDASKLLQDKKKALDEENVQIKASYDTQIDMLKEHVTNEDGTTNQEVQTEIDKFTKLRDEKTKLKTDEWAEYIKILSEKNPEALALINTFNGEVLTKEDKQAQDKLSKMEETYQGLNQITESGTYKIWNTASNSAEDVTVTIDKATGKITGAYSATTGQVAGYTDEMAKANAELGRTHTELAATCQTAMNNLSAAHIDASGKITSASGETVGALENVATATDGTMTGIYNLNGTPIEIKTNKDGTISNLDEVIKKILEIPNEKYVTIKTKFTMESDGTSEADGWKALRDTDKANNYTGTNTIKTGLSHVNEHGYETANNDNVKMLSNGLAFLIGNHYSGGDGINTHMTTMNEMQSDISNKVNDSFGKIVTTFVNALGGQSNLLNAIANNTLNTVVNGQKGNQLNEKLANDLVSKYNSTNGSFTGLQNEITSANDAKTKASNMKVEDNYWYSSTKSQLDALEKQIDNTTDDAAKKTLEKEKDTLKDTVDYYKDAAQKEIDTCKDNADQQVKIAEDKKDKLTKLAEATTNAIKAQLEKEKTAADKVITDRMAAEEKEYNAKIANIESETTAKSKAIDEQIAALEEETQAESRADERKTAKDNINMLETKMSNTKSQADKDSIALQIKDAKKELNNKENSWNIEDEKAALEEEKTTLEEKAQAQKDSLQKEYETQKASEEEKLKATDEYYSKLLETDSLNAQARYTMLTSSNNDLVALLNSYAPGWQDAGQTLADSLLTGLNSSKQSVQDAVNDMVTLRSGTSNTSSRTYYDADTGQYKGYASGTPYNPTSGLYKVDEKGFETRNSGSVAYVSKGASINNNMQSKQFLSDEISRQVALMRASVLQAQSQMQAQVLSNITNSTNNSKVYNDNAIKFNVENFHNYDTKTDVGDISRELGSYQQQKKLY